MCICLGTRPRKQVMRASSPICYVHAHTHTHAHTHDSCYRSFAALAQRTHPEPERIHAYAQVGYCDKGARSSCSLQETKFCNVDVHCQPDKDSMAGLPSSGHVESHSSSVRVNLTGLPVHRLEQLERMFQQLRLDLICGLCVCKASLCLMECWGMSGHSLWC